jgi:hypothetical protein
MVVCDSGGDSASRVSRSVVSAVVERTTEHVPAVVAATMELWRVAGLADNARALTTALQADV